MQQSVTHSDSLVAITSALILFHKQCPKIPKSAKNPFLKSRYADLSTILDIVQPVLNECDLAIQQHPTGEYGLATLLSHTSGEWIRSEYKMQPLESVVEKGSNGVPAVKAITPQSIGSVITYQRRYAIGAILNLNIDDDTDANPPGAMDSGNGNGAVAEAAPKLSAKELMAQAAAKVAPAAEATAATVSTTTAATATTAVDQPGNGLEITQGQRELIEKLFAACQITPAQQLEVHQKRGLQTLRSYSYEQAGELIGKLETKLAGIHQDRLKQGIASPLVDTTGGQSLSGQTSLNITQPATASAEQVKAIGDAIEEWAQSQPGIAEDFVARLTASGVGKRANLSYAQASDLLEAIRVRNIANFFEQSLQTTS